MARYRIVPNRSQVWIDARSTLHPIRSRTDGLEGFLDLELDDAGHVQPGSSQAAELTLDVRRLSSGNRLEDQEMQRRIDARRYPRIVGVLVEMDPAGSDQSYHVSGDVTFRGVARRCQDQMTLSVLDDETVQLAGSSRFDIRDFGMQPPRVLMLRVEPEVDVRVEIVARKEA